MGELSLDGSNTSAADFAMCRTLIVVRTRAGVTPVAACKKA
jgi:hypothetical protein